jgi:hypothetical protein
MEKASALASEDIGTPGAIRLSAGNFDGPKSLTLRGAHRHPDTRRTMTTSISDHPGRAIEPALPIEQALQRLKTERAAYVARLTARLERTDGGKDVDGYLERIENINAAIIRLASVVMRH